MLGASGYKTKKELKQNIGKELRHVETSMFGAEFKPNGWNTMVGPDAYTDRKWYANILCDEGIIQQVK